MPRLFAYHADVEAGSAQAQTFAVMERRLLRFIMNPALIAVWALGIALASMNPALLSGGWLHVKLLCVTGLTALHMVFAIWRKQLEAGRNVHSPRFYKIVNEVPTVLMIVAVIMVIVKPF